jgi:hypothetical protein
MSDPMSEPATQTCAHEPCDCRLPAGKAYCSEYCRQADATSSVPADRCDCGHPSCGENP